MVQLVERKGDFEILENIFLGFVHGVKKLHWLLDGINNQSISINK